MYKSAPQSNDYALIQKLQRINKILFTVVIILSLLSTLTTSKIIIFPESIEDIKNILYIGLMISLSIITIIIDYYLIPNAQRTTRCDFYDHSLGTKYIHHKSSEDYYNNTHLEHGLYKMAANLFESCFFTYSISSRMIIKRIFTSCILLAVLIPLLFYGFKNTSLIGVILLQALLSIYFIGGLIRLLVFVNKNRELFEELKSLFSNNDLKTNTNKYFTSILKIYTDYESNKAWSYIQLDSKLYIQLNEELSKVWIEMQNKYGIQ